MKKKLGIAAVMLAIAVLWWQQKSPSEEKKIGIVQMISHPALNETREGFLAALKEEKSSLSAAVQNAEGSLSQARSIVQAFHADPSIKAIFAIATGAAQTAVSIENEKPVFYAAVTDPVQAGIVKENSCGVSDLVDVKVLVAMMLDLFPEAKKIAIPFNPSEANSMVLVRLLKEELKRRSLEPIEVGISQESEVATAIAKASSLADVFLVPTDNLMASAMPLVVQTAAKQNKAVIASFNTAVSQGALASRGVDYFELGKEAGRMAVDVLERGKKPSEINNNIMMNAGLPDQRKEEKK